MSRRRGGRLLIYSQDGLGLGHLRRTTAIADEFLRSRPGSCALTVSDSPLGRFFTGGGRHDYLKLPSIRKVAPGQWQPLSLPMPFNEVLALRRDTLRTVALSYRPDVLLVDHMPHGAMGELVPTLEALEDLPVRRVLGLRDILDAPGVIRQRWEVEGAYDAVTRHYDHVLVYGTQAVFDVAEQYDWPAEAARRLSYCGYVCARPARVGAKRLRDRYVKGVTGGKLLVAMGGGGADAYPLFSTLLDALPAIIADQPCTLVIVTGPFLPAAASQELTRQARGLPVRVLSSVVSSYRYLAAADLVVAMAGYNTTAEILSLGQRALLVPRSGPSAEQRMRAELFARRGWVSWLPPEQLAVRPLASAVLAALADEPDRAAVLGADLAGRQAVSAQLGAILDRAPLSGPGAPLPLDPGLYPPEQRTPGAAVLTTRG